MILNFENVSSVRSRKEQTYELLNTYMEFNKQENIAIFSFDQQSKDLIFRLITGEIEPTRGKIIRKGSISPIVDRYPYLHPDLSGEENIRFISKIYGQDTKKLIRKIRDFGMLGNELSNKTKNYTNKLRRKISISISLQMKSDMYALASDLKHPEQQFNANVNNRIKEIAKDSSLVFSSTNAKFILKHANKAYLNTSDGKVQVFEDLSSAIQTHKKIVMST